MRTVRPFRSLRMLPCHLHWVIALIGVGTNAYGWSEHRSCKDLLAADAPAKSEQDPRWFEPLRSNSGFTLSDTHLNSWFKWVEDNAVIKTTQEWLKLSSEEIHALPGGTKVLEHFNHNLYLLIRFRYPELPASPWELSRTPAAFRLSEQNNRVLWLRWFESEHGIQRPEDWYAYGLDDVRAAPKGGTFMSHYGSKFYEMISSFYPHLLPWLFKSVPNLFWRDPNNIIWWKSWFEETRGAGQLQTLSKQELQEVPGVKSILRELRGDWIALFDLLSSESAAEKVKATTPPAEEEDIAWFLTHFQLQSSSDWYGLSRDDVLSEFRAAQIVSEHGGELYYLAEGLGWDLKPWHFVDYSWTSIEDQWNYLEWASETYNLTSSDWVRMRYADLARIEGWEMLWAQYHSLPKIKERFFPEAYHQSRNVAPRATTAKRRFGR